MPPAEIILWSELKNKRLDGYKFRRQYSIENYVVDFYCPELKLAIEVDGQSHYIDGATRHDKKRQDIIESFGINILRFTNREVYENIEGVLIKLKQHIGKKPPLTPPCQGGD